jgi:hypothetical protein
MTNSLLSLDKAVNRSKLEEVIAFDLEVSTNPISIHYDFVAHLDVSGREENVSEGFWDQLHWIVAVGFEKGEMGYDNAGFGTQTC